MKECFRIHNMSPKKNTSKAKEKDFHDQNTDGLDSGDDNYRRRRDRNNLAVKRSRVKSRIKTQETMERVNKLKTENDMLEEKIKILSRELSFLKNLFLAHAGSTNGIDMDDIDLESLLADAVDTPPSVPCTSSRSNYNSSSLSTPSF
ncbi:hypothetical protein M8J76_009254 [Diaphorina citri]|nr:hypothetical protein M8J76_009254 [Diaphorina citri]